MTTYCILALLFSGTAQVQTTKRDIVQEKIITASVGGNATFRCLYEEEKKEKVNIYWYRQKLGDRPCVISSATVYIPTYKLHNEYKNDSRFSVQNHPGVTNLTIRHLRLSDSAAYYCGMSGYSNPEVIDYEHGSFLHVKGSELAKRAVIRQGPAQVLLPGNAVNLSCEVHAAELCSGKHSVYWYRPSGSRPSLLYAHADPDLCNSHPGDGLPPALKSCTFHLPMANLRTEDAGTYYCVLSLCGEMLFGNGTAVEIVDLCHDRLVMYILGPALAVTLILLFILTCLYVSRKNCPCRCRGEVTEPRGRVVAMETRGPEVDNLLYVAVSARNSRRRGGARNSRRRGGGGSTEPECFYSAVAARH